MARRGADTQRPISNGRTDGASTSSQSQAFSGAQRMKIFGDEIALSYSRFVAEKKKEYKGSVYFGSDWCDFCVRPDDFEEGILTAIENQLNELYKKPVASLRAHGLWAIGLPCAARYIKDNQWYRATLIDLDYRIVRFVDWGNLQKCEIENIKPLTRTLAEIAPPATFRCTTSDSQHDYLPANSEQDCPLSVTILNDREPYEVILKLFPTDSDSNPSTSTLPEILSDELNVSGEEAIDFERPSLFDLQIQMVKENVMNFLAEEKIFGTGFLLDLAVPRIEFDENRFEDQLIDEASTSSMSVLLKPVPIGMQNRLLIPTRPTTANVNGAAPMIEFRTVECQTDLSLSSDQEGERLRSAAIEDIKKMRKDKDLVEMMKFAFRMTEFERTKFFELLEHVA